MKYKYNINFCSFSSNEQRATSNVKRLFALCMGLLLLLAGCAHEESNIDGPDTPDVPSGTDVPVRITISARPINAQTRADDEKKPDGTPKNPTSSVELIHDWWIAFVNDKKGTVKVINRNEVKDKITSTSVNIDGGGFEAETFRTIIPAGKYRIYTFANIDYKTEEQMNGLLGWTSDKKEYKLINKYIKDFVDDPKFDNEVMIWPSNKNIPMTGTFTQTIDNTVEATLNFEVIRAVAKVEFAFSNPSTDKITLKELTFGHISKGEKISIVPNYSAVGQAANTDKLPDDIGDDKGTYTFSMDNLLAALGGKYTHVFYCKESLGSWYGQDGKFLAQYDKDKKKVEANEKLADHKDVFKIDLTVEREKSGETTETETLTRTFYTNLIKYINRNDWIYIPIKFNNWKFKWKLHYYPPIGGYPPVFEQSDDGSSLSAKLTTGGEFELYPVEVMQNTTKYDVDMTRNDMTVTVKSGKELFVTEPHLIDNPNVSGHPLSAFQKIITGELDPKKTGTADIEITFHLTAASGITEAFKCTFHIIRQNTSPSSN